MQGDARRDLQAIDGVRHPHRSRALSFPPVVHVDELLNEDDKVISEGDLAEIIAPDFGARITIVTLTKWLCSVGSRV